MSSEIEILQRRIAREVAAREEAERILEQKSLELYHTNQELLKLNESLEEQVEERGQALIESQTQYKFLVESAVDIIFTANADGALTYVNPAAVRVFGYSEQDLLKQNYFDLIRESDRERVIEFYTQMVKNQEESTYLEFPTILKNGETKWLGQLVRIEYKNKKPYIITAVARDIQDLRDARTALENSEKKYRGIIEGMELGLLEVNRKGKVVFVNYWFCEMTGYAPSELIGKNPDDLLLNDAGKELMAAQDDNRLQGKAGVYEIEIRKKSGDFLWTAVSGAPIYNRDGEVIGSVGMHLDISSQKEMNSKLKKAIAEAEKARMAEKEFLAHMSHEIRTPLNAVMGMANLLSSTDLTTQQMEYVTDMKHASDVLHGLISDVLDISKIEAGEIELRESVIDIASSLSMLARTIEYRATEKNNKIYTHIHKDVPKTLIADRNVFNQVFLNLLGNANKFTEKGTIDISIGGEDLGANAYMLKVVIKDTGIGIEKDRLGQIFERFQQARRSPYNGKEQGTGLGLSICKQLVELHGGSIDVASTLHEGSSFSFSLKTTRTPNFQGDEGLSSVGNEAVSSLKEYEVLVAEDSYLNRKYLQGLLEQWGMKYEISVDGKEALDLSKQKKYDLILLDLQMPVLDGYQAAEKIRSDAANPNNNTPLLALTASALIDEKKKALEAGMQDHLTKPFTPFQLREFMSRNLSQSKTPEVKRTQRFDFKDLDLPEYIDALDLNEMYEGDTEHAKLMFDIFTSTVWDDLDQIMHHQNQNETEQLTSLIHKTAPVFAMVGLSRIQKEMIEIELELKDTGLNDSLSGRLERVIDLARSTKEGCLEALEKLNKLN